MDDQIIDLGEYLRRREERAQEERSTFALWGGEGDRSRFALPLWRAAYILGGRRAALVWELAHGQDGPRPLVVLDLWADPPRIDIPPGPVEALRGSESAPACVLGPDGLGFYLGEKDGRRWYLVVTGPEGDLVLTDEEKDDLHFLAGECAGLLFYRDLDRDPGDDS